MNIEIDGLHHVGHIVRNIDQALSHYRKLGFQPTLAHFYNLETEGMPSETIGPVNAYSSLDRSFIEVVSVISNGQPLEGGEAQSIVAPPEYRDAMAAQFSKAGEMIAGWFGDYEGLHIVCLRTRDVEGTAQRLVSAGVGNTGASTVNRKVQTKNGLRVVPTRLLEIGAPGEDTKLSVPEGRVAIAEGPDFELLHGQGRVSHPNGAIELVEAYLHAGGAAFESTACRYESYIGLKPTRTNFGWQFDMGGARITILDDSGLKSVFPGAVARVYPALVGYAVSVSNISATAKYLAKAGFQITKTEAGEVLVPSSSAIGAAILFRPEN